jgi:hypothetical protein
VFLNALEGVGVVHGHNWGVQIAAANCAIVEVAGGSTRPVAALFN